MAAKMLLNEFGLSCDLAISGQKGLRLFEQRMQQMTVDPETKPL